MYQPSCFVSLHSIEVSRDENYQNSIKQCSDLWWHGNNSADNSPCSSNVWRSEYLYSYIYIFKLTSFYMSWRVDFICDKYNPLSIKKSKRRQCSISAGYLLPTPNENQKTPIQFQKFLMSGKNKDSIVLCIVMHRKKLAPEEFHGKPVFALWNQGCFMSPQNNPNELITETLLELTTDH